MKRNHKQSLRERLTANPIIGVLLVVVAIVVGSGAVLSAMMTARTFWNTFIDPREDLREFEFGSQSVRLTGGTGVTLDQAVIIEGALTSDVGIAAEHYWIETFYPDYRITAQGLIRNEEQGSRAFDVFYLESSTGTRRELYFEITDFFGAPVSDIEIQRYTERVILEQERIRQELNDED